MTQHEFARRIGRGKTTVYAWMIGGVAPSAVFDAADILECDPRYLLDPDYASAAPLNPGLMVSGIEIAELVTEYCRLSPQQRGKIMAMLKQL